MLTILAVLLPITLLIGMTILTRFNIAFNETAAALGLIFLMSALISGGIDFAFKSKYGYSEEINEVTEISALSNGSETSGVFFLGSGTIDNEQVYYYMEKTKHGLKMENIRADNVFINETNEGTPNITTYTNHYGNEKVDKFLIGDFDSRIVINVPVNTLDSEFNINLESN